jgi:hypothetical protein
MIRESLLIALFGLLPVLQASAITLPTPTPSSSLTSILGPPGRPQAITFMPVTITAPGNYYLASNLDLAQTAVSFNVAAAITVNSPGRVVIDLRGHTVSGPVTVVNYFYSDGNGGYQSSPNPSLPQGGYITYEEYNVVGLLLQSNDVTIMNGAVSGFWNSLVTGSWSSHGMLA